MKFLGILITLAIIGYAVSVYLDSSNLPATPGGASKPADYIDEARKSTDAIGDALKTGKERLDDAN